MSVKRYESILGDELTCRISQIEEGKGVQVDKGKEFEKFKTPTLINPV